MDRSLVYLARSRPGLVALVAAGLALVGLSVAAAWPGGLGGAPRFHGTAYLPPEPAADFRLTDHLGRPASMAELRGRAVLLFFGYTSCPDVCPLTLTKLSRVLQDMEADTADVRVLLVTVDPQRDTPDALARYVERFAPHVHGLTGDSATLARVRAAYYAHAMPHTDESGHAQVNHTPAVFGIDRQGQVRVLLPMHLPEREVARDIRALLRG